MGRPDSEPGDDEAEQASLARDFVMARLAAARIRIASALASMDESIANFVEPDDDKNGKTRTAAMEECDALLGAAASSLHLAMEQLADVDPTEEEPDEEEDDEEPAPTRRGRRKR